MDDDDDGAAAAAFFAVVVALLVLLVDPAVDLLTPAAWREAGHVYVYVCVRDFFSCVCVCVRGLRTFVSPSWHEGRERQKAGSIKG